MELVVEDQDGYILGSRDLEGSRWEQIGQHFINLQEIVVAIAASGTFGTMYIKNGNERIGGASRLTGQLHQGSEVRIPIGGMPLSWHERRPEDSVSRSHVEFAKNTVAEMRLRANKLEALLNTEDIPAAVVVAINDLLAAVYDLLASLSII
jgi:hypothetical protein